MTSTRSHEWAKSWGPNSHGSRYDEDDVQTACCVNCDLCFEDPQDNNYYGDHGEVDCVEALSPAWLKSYGYPPFCPGPPKTVWERLSQEAEVV